MCGSRRPRRTSSAQLVDSVARRIDVMRSLLATDRWSLATLAFTELDRWGHGWRRRATAGDEAARATAIALLSAIDAFVGELRNAQPDAQLLVLSAHGVAPAERLIDLDAWLGEAGLQSRTDDGALGEDSVAFSMEGGRIYFHAARMFSEGRLAGGSVLPLMDEIERSLLSHRAADGAAPLRAVLRRRDIYHGPHARVAPHLVAVPALGWGIAGSERGGPTARASTAPPPTWRGSISTISPSSSARRPPRALPRRSRTWARPSSTTSVSTPRTSTGHRSPPEFGRFGPVRCGPNGSADVTSRRGPDVRCRYATQYLRVALRWDLSVPQDHLVLIHRLSVRYRKPVTNHEGAYAPRP